MKMSEEKKLEVRAIKQAKRIEKFLIKLGNEDWEATMRAVDDLVLAHLQYRWDKE